MADVVALLRQLGFGDYEARAYVALLQRSPLNGYELASVSRLPRANVYGVLQKLEARGAVVRVDAPAGVRYAPVAPPELVRRLAGNFQSTLEAAQRSLEEVAGPAEVAHVWNIHGAAALLDHAGGLVDATQGRLLVAIWPQEAVALAPHLDRAEARGVELTTLCLAACPRDCADCRGRIYRYRVVPEQRTRWLVLVPDGAEVLAGEIGSGEAALSVRTRQRLLVELASWYIRHSIALAAVLTDLGPRLDHLLGPETQSMLAAIGPGGRGGGWLEYMREILGHD